MIANEPKAALSQISDAKTAVEMTLELLAVDSSERILVVSKHPERPITELVFVHRRCNKNPPPDIKTLVQALSVAQQGVRSFSGDSCKQGVYIGNNIWGNGFEKRAIYCPGCGYSMGGPQIHHVKIIESGDDEWNRRMVDQCEIGAWWDEGKNLGLTYEMALSACNLVAKGVE